MDSIFIVPTIFLALAGSTSVVQEQLLASPDSKIESVITEGAWENAGVHGTYRVVLWTEGFEHVSSGVVAEWISDAHGENERREVVHSEVLIAPGLFVFQKPSFNRTKNGYSVVLTGVNTYLASEKASCTFELLPSREVKVIKPCG